MSTRSNVGIKEGNKFKYIYVHFDGYPTGVGETLRRCYTDPKKVEELISLGDCSVLGDDLDPERESFDDYNSKILNENGSLFYGRDRGEKDTEAREVEWNDYLKEVSDDIWIEYIYVFENGKWTGYRNAFNFEDGCEPKNLGVAEIKDEEYEDA